MNVICYELICYERGLLLIGLLWTGLLWTWSVLNGLFWAVCYEQVCFERSPSLFDNDIHTGTNPTEDVSFHRFKYFFHQMIAGEHCNDQKICLFYSYIYYSSLPNFILRKNRFDRIFQN